MPPGLDDLLLAFRQAKTTHYFERRGVGLLGLAEFEDQLSDRLTSLQTKLGVNGGWFDGLEVGELRVVPKRIRSAISDVPGISRIGSLEPGQEALDLDVQIRLTPSPDLAIVEVLYLWRFGALLDSLLSPSCVGYRLDTNRGEVSHTRRWLFEYWPKRYQEFRTAPIEAARRALRNETSAVTILSADFASFYDSIDPAFMVSEAFVKGLASARVKLPENEVEAYLAATRSLLGFFERFQRLVRRRTGLKWTTGIPIGALTSRLVANLALESLDRAISAQSNVLSYRRYVDDVVVVASAERNAPLTVEGVVEACLPSTSKTDGVFKVDAISLGREGCELALQGSKIKVHHLSGIQGRDFIGAVQKDFQRVVSESRSFLEPSVFTPEAAARLIRARKGKDSPLRVFRDADKVKLEHFELSISLRSLERVSILLDTEEARRLAERTLREITRFLSGDSDWVENLDLAFRLLGLGVACGDGIEARTLSVWMDSLWEDEAQLKKTIGALYHRDQLVTSTSAWTSLRDYLHLRRLETVCGAIRPTAEDPVTAWIAEGGLLVRTRTIGVRAVQQRARLMAAADLRARDREDDRFDAGVGRQQPVEKLTLFDQTDLAPRLALIKRFSDLSYGLGDSAWPADPARLLLCTRPPSYFDVARRWLYRAESNGFSVVVFQELLDVVNAIRGTAYRDPVGRVLDDATVRIPVDNDWVVGSVADPRVILGNLSVKEAQFTAAATRTPGSTTGRPDLSAERLRGLSAVIEAAEQATKHRQRGEESPPSVLVLPELSLPRDWFRSVSNHVVRFGHFGLVAGLEYLHDATFPVVYNQVFAVLPGPYSSVATWPWTKRLPAREEAQALRSLPVPVSFGSPTRKRPPRTVVDSPYGRFSVLVCSEMLEARLSADLLGRVEVILAPSWNKDTASYDHLIQSVALQLHAVVAIANNGHYSDCRVWAPKSERWRRDLCRLVERDVNDVVFADIPLSSLRAFRAAGGVSGVSDPPKPMPGPEWRPLPPDWP